MSRVLSIHPVPDRGGSDRALLTMAKQFQTAGVDVHVVFPARSALSEEFDAAGVTTHVVPMRRLTGSGGALYWLGYLAAWPLAVWRLGSVIRATRPDVVHSNSLHSWYGWAAAMLTRRPHIWSAREIVVQSPAALWVERFLTRHFADLVIAMSAAIADQLRVHGSEPPRRGAPVVVVLDEPDPDIFNPRAAGVFRPRVGIPDDAPLVATIGRVDTWKGFDVLLAAVPAIQSRCPGAHVLFAGPAVNGKEAYAEELASTARTMDKVTWLGARDDAAELLADLDVFVMASTEPEPFGMVMTESLACGVPVVATSAGGPLEVIGADQRLGRLVPPGDAAALADAVVALLGDGSTSKAQRQGRAPLRTPDPSDFLAWFEWVAAGADGSTMPGEGHDGVRP